MAIQVQKVTTANYSSSYKDNLLDIEAKITTNPLNIQVSTPYNTELLTPGQVQAQYEYFKELNNLVQTVSLGKTPRVKSEKTQSNELIHQD